MLTTHGVFPCFLTVRSVTLPLMKRQGFRFLVHLWQAGYLPVPPVEIVDGGDNLRKEMRDDARDAGNLTNPAVAVLSFLAPLFRKWRNRCWYVAGDVRRRVPQLTIGPPNLLPPRTSSLAPSPFTPYWIRAASLSLVRTHLCWHGPSLSCDASEL
jgi:hypothetical protein